MCQNSKLEVISQNKFGYIGQCQGCKRFNLVFGNLFLLLIEDEINALGRMLENKYGLYYHENSIGNNKQVSMNTPLQNMYLAFNMEEYETFIQMITETNLILDARNVLNNCYIKSKNKP